MAPVQDVGLSLGSNLGDRRRHLTRALARLDRELLGDMQVSSLWESEPVDVAEAQPAYLNLCAAGMTALGPEELLARCRELEREAGRLDEGHRRPRTLDLDLLWHGDARREDETLRLPHPRLAERRFVLAPLAEIRPDWVHPVSRRGLSEMLDALGNAQPARVLEGGGDWWRHD